MYKALKLIVNNLVKTFGDKVAVDGISFTAESGKALGLLGRNGAGKTTTIRMIMGLFQPDSGEILLDDKPLVRRYGSIGYLPEERGLYLKRGILEQLVYFGKLRGLTGEKAKEVSMYWLERLELDGYASKKLDILLKRGILEQLVYFGKLRGLTGEKAKEVSMYWLERLELDGYASKKLDILSKGNQQKIQLAQALLSDPDILVLDEPFSGFDPVNASMLKDIVKEKISEGKVVVFSSHQMNYVEEFCDNIVIIKNGKVVVGGSIREIRRSYDRTRLVVGSTESQRIKTAMENHPCIAKIEEKDSYQLVLTMNSEGDKAQVMQSVAGLGIDYDQLYIEEPGLSEIFVSCTEG